ncbi:MAG: hypothetical protein JNJ88_14740 [Planctomycetes bacterium]|nr:hypothetical protein [Planctomycetota bacterium]
MSARLSPSDLDRARQLAGLSVDELRLELEQTLRNSPVTSRNATSRDSFAYEEFCRIAVAGSGDEVAAATSFENAGERELHATQLKRRSRNAEDPDLPTLRKRIEAAASTLLFQLASDPNPFQREDHEYHLELLSLVRFASLRGCLRPIALLAREAFDKPQEFDGHLWTQLLVTLATIQEPALFEADWLKLWDSNDPDVWPMALSGLQRANPPKAIEILEEAITRIKSGQELPLGQAIWSFAHDPQIDRAALRTMLVKHLEIVNSALQKIGSSALGVLDLSKDANEPTLAASPDTAETARILHLRRKKLITPSRVLQKLPALG